MEVQETFAQLDGIEELDRITDAGISIYDKFHTSTENILV